MGIVNENLSHHPGFHPALLLSGTRYSLGSSLTPRTQNIASGMQVMGFRNSTVSNGTDTAFNDVIFRNNECGKTVTALQLVYPGWYCTSTEVNMTGSMSITASIEYPIGTRTQVTFSASTTGTVAPGTNLVSDSITIPGGIPAGATFGVRTFGTVSSGVVWGTALTFTSNSNKDSYQSGASGVILDQTMSGTPSGTNPGYHPVAILATGTGFKSVCLAALGDSIAAGQGDSFNDAANNTGAMGRAATGKCPILNLATSGSQAQPQIGTFTNRLDLMAKAGINVVRLEWGTNDLNTGAKTAVQTTGYLSTLAGLIKGAIPGCRVYANTYMPRVTTVDVAAYEGLTAQTSIGGNFGTYWTSANSLIRAGLTNIDGYVEWADLISCDASNNLVRDGLYFKYGPYTYLEFPFPATVQASPLPTSTTFTTDVIKTANYLSSGGYGRVLWTSGLNSGTISTILSNDASGGITLSAALANIPIAGDTCRLVSQRVAATIDGIHPQNTDNTVPYGAMWLLRDAEVAFLTSLGV